MSDDPSKVEPSYSGSGQRSSPIPSNVNGGTNRRTAFTVNLAVAGKRLLPPSNEKQATEAKRDRRDDSDKRLKFPKKEKQKTDSNTIQSHGILSDGIGPPKPSMKSASELFRTDGSKKERKRVICEEDDEDDDRKSGPSRKTEIVSDLSDEQVLKKLLSDSVIAEHYKEKRKTNSPVSLLTKIEQVKLENETGADSSNFLANENELLLLQMPSCLSQMVHKADATEDEKTAWATGHPMAGLPEGKIGQIHLMKSGRIFLQIGDHKFAIKPGASVSFQQKLISIDDGHLYELGPVNQRLLVVPDLDPPTIPDANETEI